MSESDKFPSDLDDRRQLEGLGNISVELQEKHERLSRPVLSRLYDMAIKKHDVVSIESAEILHPIGIVKNHLQVWPAAGNGGKTTTHFAIAKQLALAGMDVIYINADISPADVGYYYDQVESIHNFQLVVPDMKASLQIANDVLRLLASADENLSNTIIYLDTFKKFVSMMDKTAIADFNSTLRQIQAKGATITCLSHTNKDDETYEGTGDIRNDADELIFMHNVKIADNKMLISTEPDKVRSKIEPASFEVTRGENDIKVDKVPYIDLRECTDREKVIDQDRSTWREIEKVLEKQPLHATDIINEITERERDQLGEAVTSGRKVRHLLKAASSGPYAPVVGEKAANNATVFRLARWTYLNEYLAVRDGTGPFDEL